MLPDGSRGVLAKGSEWFVVCHVKECVGHVIPPSLLHLAVLVVILYNGCRKYDEEKRWIETCKTITVTLRKVGKAGLPLGLHLLLYDSQDPN